MEGKVVVVTGSSSGIGKETAFAFAKEGANVVVTYNKEKREGESVLKKCKELGSADPLLLQLDVRDDKSIKNAVQKTIAKYKKIDILVNNAGIVVWEKLKRQDFKEIEDQIRTNLEGLIKMTRVCLPYIKDLPAQAGTIINISSGLGITGYADSTVYCATKFGIRGFTQSLALETDLKVYSVNPGMTATRMTDYQGTPPEKVAEIIVNTAKGEYNVESGGDVNVWEYI